MEQWEDQGIILSVRPHGESGAIVGLLTENLGRHAGYVRGAGSSKMRGTLEAGSLVDARWQSRTSDQLGSYALELSRSYAAFIMQEPLKLAALQSACALCDTALPDREGHPGLFHGLLALFDALQSDVWAQAYIMWEIAFLKELGFSLDFSKCAGGGPDDNLLFVSPKTGRAVSAEAGDPYKDKLLTLPVFLRPQGGDNDEQEDIMLGLKLTSYFLEHWVFVHHSSGLPEARARLALRFEQHFAKTKDHNEKENMA